MANVVPFIIQQGSTFKVKLTLTTDSGPINISDYKFDGQIKNSVYDTSGHDIKFEVINPLGGSVLAIVEDDESEAMDFTQGNYNIRYTLRNGESYRLLEGPVTIDLGGGEAKEPTIEVGMQAITFDVSTTPVITLTQTEGKPGLPMLYTDLTESDKEDLRRPVREAANTAVSQAEAYRDEALTYKDSAKVTSDFIENNLLPSIQSAETSALSNKNLAEEFKKAALDAAGDASLSASASDTSAVEAKRQSDEATSQALRAASEADKATSEVTRAQQVITTGLSDVNDKISDAQGEVTKVRAEAQTVYTQASAAAQSAILAGTHAGDAQNSLTATNLAKDAAEKAKSDAQTLLRNVQSSTLDAAASAQSASVSAATATQEASQIASSTQQAVADVQAVKVDVLAVQTDVTAKASQVTTDVATVSADKTAAEGFKDAAETAKDKALVAQQSAETAAANLPVSLAYQGVWDASTGNLPTQPTTSSRWLVSIPGTIGGQDYQVGDSIVWNNLAGDWERIGSTTQAIKSVNGVSGLDITLDAGDVGALPITGGSLAGPLTSSSTIHTEGAQGYIYTAGDVGFIYTEGDNAHIYTKGATANIEARLGQIREQGRRVYSANNKPSPGELGTYTATEIDTKLSNLTATDVGALPTQGQAVDSKLLAGKTWDTHPTANHIVARDANADISARMFKSSYPPQAGAIASSAALCFRNNATSDTYIRTAGKSVIKTWLGYSASDIGALPISGGTLTGDVVIANEEASLTIQSDINKDSKISFREGVVQNGGFEVSYAGASDNELKINSLPRGSSPEITTLTINRENGYVDAKVRLHENGSRVYSGANKPTPAAIGALPANTPLFSGDYGDLTNKPSIPSKASDVGALPINGGALTGILDSNSIIRTDGTNAFIHTTGSAADIYTNGTSADIYTSGTNADIEARRGQVKERGQRVYSPNNKPSASDLGITTASLGAEPTLPANQKRPIEIATDEADALSKSKSNPNTLYIVQE